MCAGLRKNVPGLAADHCFPPELTMAVELLRDGRIINPAPAAGEGR